MLYGVQEGAGESRPSVREGRLRPHRRLRCESAGALSRREAGLCQLTSPRKEFVLVEEEEMRRCALGRRSALRDLILRRGPATPGLKERRVVFLNTIYKNLTGDGACVDEFFKKSHLLLIRVG